MKQFFLIAVLALTSLQSLAETKTTLEASLTKFTFQNGSPLSLRKINSGHVLIDLEAGQILLTLQPAFFCPGQYVCAMVMPQPVRELLPLKSIRQGGCGETVYTAEKNLLLVDGLRTTIEVVDNSQNICDIVTRPVTVQLTNEFPMTGDIEIHHMSGDEFLN